MDDLDAKYAALIERLRGFGKVAIAFSAGVDSTLLLAAAHEALGDDVVAITAVSPASPRRETEAAAAFSPAVIANYCYDLAKEFNQYYHETPILKEPDGEVLRMRLELISTLASVLRRGMKILGIDLPDRM